MRLIESRTSVCLTSLEINSEGGIKKLIKRVDFINKLIGAIIINCIGIIISTLIELGIIN